MDCLKILIYMYFAVNGDIIWFSIETVDCEEVKVFMYYAVNADNLMFCYSCGFERIIFFMYSTINADRIWFSVTAVDCEVSDWYNWKPCNNPCGLGSQERRREVTRPAQNGGRPCPVLREKRACIGTNDEECLQQSVEYQGKELRGRPTHGFVICNNKCV